MGDPIWLSIPTADLEIYIQETGRGGRDGNITFAKLLTVNRQNRFCEQSMLGYQKACHRGLAHKGELLKGKPKHI